MKLIHAIQMMVGQALFVQIWYVVLVVIESDKEEHKKICLIPPCKPYRKDGPKNRFLIPGCIMIAALLLAFVPLSLWRTVSNWGSWRIHTPSPRPHFFRTPFGWVKQELWERSQAKRAKRKEAKRDQHRFYRTSKANYKWIFHDPTGELQRRFDEQKKRSHLRYLPSWMRSYPHGTVQTGYLAQRSKLPNGFNQAPSFEIISKSRLSLSESLENAQLDGCHRSHVRPGPYLLPDLSGMEFPQAIIPNIPRESYLLPNIPTMDGPNIVQVWHLREYELPEYLGRPRLRNDAEHETELRGEVEESQEQVIRIDMQHRLEIGRNQAITNESDLEPETDGGDGRGNRTDPATAGGQLVTPTPNTVTAAQPTNQPRPRITRPAGGFGMLAHPGIQPRPRAIRPVGGFGTLPTPQRSLTVPQMMDTLDGLPWPTGGNLQTRLQNVWTRRNVRNVQATGSRLGVSGQVNRSTPTIVTPPPHAEANRAVMVDPATADDASLDLLSEEGTCEGNNVVVDEASSTNEISIANASAADETQEGGTSAATEEPSTNESSIANTSSAEETQEGDTSAVTEEARTHKMWEEISNKVLLAPTNEEASTDEMWEQIENESLLPKDILRRMDAIFQPTIRKDDANLDEADHAVQHHLQPEEAVVAEAVHQTPAVDNQTPHSDPDSDAHVQDVQTENTAAPINELRDASSSPTASATDPSATAAKANAGAAPSSRDGDDEYVEELYTDAYP